MAYVKTQDGQPQKFPYTIGCLRKDNSSTSFPRHICAETLAAYGVFEVIMDTPPAVDSRSQKAARSNAPVYINSEWRLQWSVVEKTPEERQAYSDAAAKKVRVRRNTLLSDSDWTQVADAPVDTAAWATYRQALRDITDHANFPYLEEADWPTKP